jgi:hypothetical protein
MTESNSNNLATGQNVMKSVNIKNGLNSPATQDKEENATLESEKAGPLEKKAKSQTKMSDASKTRPQAERKELNSTAAPSRAPSIPCYTPIQHPAHQKPHTHKTHATQEDIPEPPSAVILPNIMEKQKQEIK